ncbi:DoxX family protein [Nocardia pseudovaccinii]|uniref:DoxX family protein n=1 Tax=Nocardia pseudovaccinii TaxID=189540 RepID=UPI0007A4C4BE|nr:DoxX family protein [Nocardia pseudovaccinii]
MNIVLWVIASLLAAVFLGSGLAKLVQSKDKLASSGMGWAEDFSPGMIKILGILQLAGAVGLLVPAILDTAPILVPLAALGLAIMMAGAAIVHRRRHDDLKMITLNLVLLILAAVVAWGRFGPYAF